MDVCLLLRILSYLLKASIDSPFLRFMSFSVSKILPRYFMVFHSSLPSVPTQNSSVFSVLIFRFLCLTFKGSSCFIVSLCNLLEQQKKIRKHLLKLKNRCQMSLHYQNDDASGDREALDLARVYFLSPSDRSLHCCSCIHHFNIPPFQHSRIYGLLEKRIRGIWERDLSD